MFRREIGIKQDGEVHNTPNQMKYDREREQVLENLGNKVLRFENKMVFENLESVLQEIKDNFN